MKYTRARRLLAVLMSICICIGSTTPAFAAHTDDFVVPQNGFFATIDPELEQAYRTYSSIAENRNRYTTVSLEDFISQYNKTLYRSVNKYLDHCVAQLSTCKKLSDVQAEDAARQARASMMALQRPELRESLEDRWWHNVSTLPRAVTYGSRYNLVGTAIKGDLVYERAGGGGFTGHTVLVAGTFYSDKYDQYYIKSFEAILSGVSHGILCDERFVSQKSSLDRPTQPDASTMIAAVEWAETQDGKDYHLASPSTDISQSRENWYCSLLAYACYKAQGISLCTRPAVGYVTPAAIHNGNVSTLRSY